MPRLFLAFAILIGTLGPVSAQVFYVSPTGSDSASCTTIATACATVQAAVNLATAPGSTVAILPGNVYGGGTGTVAPVVLSHSGSGPLNGPGGACTSPITIETYPFAKERAIIAGVRNATNLGTISNSGGISCIVINNLELAGWNGDLTWAAVSAAVATSAWTNPIYNRYGVGIAASSYGNPTNVHHIVVSNNYIHDFPANGIGFTYSDFISVINNHVENNALYSAYETSCISLYQGQDYTTIPVTASQIRNIVLGNFSAGCTNLVPNRVAGSVLLTTSAAAASGATVLTFSSTTGINSTMGLLDGSGNGCLPPGEEVWYYTSTTVGLQIPTTCAIASGVAVLGGYVTDGHGIIIDNNSCSQSGSGCTTPEVGRTLVANNITVNNGNAGIQVGPGSNHVDVVFNTSYLDQTELTEANNYYGSGPISMQQTTDSTVSNNIAVSNPSVIAYANQSTSTTPIQNNIWAGGYHGAQFFINGVPASGPVNWAATLQGGDTGNLFVDPQFVSPSISFLTANFHLQRGSPAIDGGLALPSLAATISTDYLGNPRVVGAAPDIGAIESQGCSPFGGSAVTDLQGVLNQIGDATNPQVLQQVLRSLVVTIACANQH